MADKCRFALPTTTASAEASAASDSRKRQASPDEADVEVVPPAADFPSGSLGYHTAEMLAKLGLEDKAWPTVLAPLLHTNS